MIFRFADLFRVTLVSEDIHHVVQRDRLKLLDHLEAGTDRSRYRLLLQAFEEVARDTPDVNLFEFCCFIFPIHIAHDECSFRFFKFP